MIQWCIYTQNVHSVHFAAFATKQWSESNCFNILVEAWMLSFITKISSVPPQQRLKSWFRTRLSIQNVTCKRYSQPKSITCLPLCDSILRCITKYSVWGAESRVSTSECTVLFYGFCILCIRFPVCSHISHVWGRHVVLGLQRLKRLWGLGVSYRSKWR